MDAPFAAAIASTLLPGGKLANGIEAPAAGALLDQDILAAWIGQARFEALVAAILDGIGDARAYLEASPERRVAALLAAEVNQPAAFAALVSALATLYYEHPAVLEAFGWRPAPPQPDGHALAATDASLFDEVAARGPAWRRVS